MSKRTRIYVITGKRCQPAKKAKLAETEPEPLRRRVRLSKRVFDLTPLENLRAQEAEQRVTPP